MSTTLIQRDVNPAPVKSRRRLGLRNLSLFGTVNLFGAGRDKAHGADGAPPCSRDLGSTCPLGPDAEGLGSGSSVLGS